MTSTSTTNGCVVIGGRGRGGGWIGAEELVEEVDVARGQLERLYLAELVRRQRGYGVTQRGERLVQRLRALAFAHVGHHALLLHVVVATGTTTRARRRRRVAEHSCQVLAECDVMRVELMLLLLCCCWRERGRRGRGR